MPPSRSPRQQSTEKGTGAPATGDAGNPIAFETTAAWNDWLAHNGTSSPGVWLRLAKKSAGVRPPPYQEWLDVALCHGWIDAQRKGLDAGAYLQRFTPRGPRSIWSARNRARVLELMEQGRMRPAGMAAIEQARANGQWDAAYDSFATAVVPPDLQAALVAHPEASAFFLRLSAQNRYAILFRLQTARRPETRRKRLEQYVSMLERHETLYPQTAT
jgi:uncharacterized protein YdeI (YjbR/CyaY-like superfamily)